MINPESLWLDLYALMHEGIDKETRLAHKDSDDKLRYIYRYMLVIKDRGVIFTLVSKECKFEPLENQYATIEWVYDRLKLNCYSCCEKHRMYTDGCDLSCPNKQCNCLLSSYKIIEDIIKTKDAINNVYAIISSIQYNKSLNTVIIDIADNNSIKSNNL